MNEIAKKIAASLVRTALAAGGAWVARRGWLKGDEIESLVAILTGPVLAGVWGAWTQITNHKEKLTAQAGGPTTSEAVTATVKAGMAPPLTTPPNVVPELKPVAAP